jgi:hypothetical protein
VELLSFGVIVRRETTPKDRVEKQRRLRVGNQAGIRFHFGVRKSVVPDFNFQRLKSFHDQPRKVMPYIVVILTATFLAVSAFILHRTLPK